MINDVRESLRAWIDSFQLSEGIAAFLEASIGLAVVLAIAVAAQRLTEILVAKLFSVVLTRLGSDKQKQWAEALRLRFVAGKSAHIVAVLIAYALLPYALDDYPNALTVIRNIIQGYLVAIAAVAINALLGAMCDVFSGASDTEELPLRIATQAAQAVVGVVGAVVGFSVVFDRPVAVLLSGLAGATALVLLLFKDTILGFVAGIQLSGNDMLRIGDWIEVPQYGANGTVRDVRLTTVKVQNFDKTITTIPTYALVSESFKNWRGMKESGARRIKRSVIIDIESIHFLSDEEIQELEQVHLLKPHLKEQLTEVRAYNDKFAPEDRHPPNARGVTNLGTFRVYLENYLHGLSSLNEGMLILVRHLEPSAEGLPLEIYCFSNEQKWKEYERIQSRIFEHALAVLPAFGLRAYQLSKSSS